MTLFHRTTRKVELALALWRPAHLHMKVSAPGYQLITTQLYLPGDPPGGDDIASAVKPELMLDPKPAADGHGADVEYDYVLDPT